MNARTLRAIESTTCILAGLATVNFASGLCATIAGFAVLALGTVAMVVS